jgi:hypothetical protein
MRPLYRDTALGSINAMGNSHRARASDIAHGADGPRRAAGAGWGELAKSFEGLANADPVDDNGPMMVGILGLDGFSLSEILLLMVVAALLLWKHGGRPPKAS